MVVQGHVLWYVSLSLSVCVWYLLVSKHSSHKMSIAFYNVLFYVGLYTDRVKKL